MPKSKLLILMLLAWLASPRLVHAASPPAPTASDVHILEPEQSLRINGWERAVLDPQTMKLKLKKMASRQVEMRGDGIGHCQASLGADDSCEFTAQNCPKLFEPSHPKAAREITVTWEEEEPAGTVSRQAMLSVEWPVSTQVLWVSDKGELVDQLLPSSVDTSARWYTFTAGEAKWVDRGALSGGLMPKALEDAIAKTEPEAGSLTVVMRVGEDLQQLPVKRAHTDLSEFVGLTDTQFEQRCEAERAGLAPAKQFSSRQRIRAVRRKDWGYVVCVDWTKGSPRLKVVTTREGADPAAGTGVHLHEGRPVYVRVWHREGEEIAVTFDGKRGAVNYVYLQPFEFMSTEAPGGDEHGAELGGVAEHPFAPAAVTGFAAGQLAQLKLNKMRGTGASKSEQVVIHDFEVTAVYLGAIRVGFSGVWAPFDRRYATRESGDAGRVIVTEAGLDRSLMYLELVTGYSFFFTPVFEGERTLTGGFLLGVGVLGAGGQTGLDVFSSVHAGLEFDVGRDFSIAATASLRRTEVLRDGYYLGRSVGADETFTRPGVTPAFGAVLTWSPDFTKALGRAAKRK